MKLHELAPAKGSKKAAVRVGRGNGSGCGKTSGRGQKGQWARSGGGVRPGFEGGQMPITRRIPKRGFKNIFAKVYTTINVGDLSAFDEGTVITAELLKDTGFISKVNDGIKILGQGELNKKLTVKAVKFTASAKEKMRGCWRHCRGDILMFRTLGNAWKVADIRKKILYTLLMLLIYRVGIVIPAPGVNVAYIAEQVNNFTALGFLNMLSGGGLESMSIFALGISPYLNASIIMNLLTVAIPALERMAKEEENGRKKISAITRFVSIGLAIIQAVGILLGMGANAVQSTDAFNYITIVLCLTAGTAFIMWLGECINKNGIGNGISLIIFVGIVADLPSQVIGLFSNVFSGATSVWVLVGYILFAAITITAITFVDMGERRISVQYAKRVVGRKMYGGQSTFIPMKVNQSGVMPLIFAMTFVQFPGMIAQFWPNSGFYQWYTEFLGNGQLALCHYLRPAHHVLYILLFPDCV